MAITMEVHLMNYDGLNCLESQIGCHLADGSFVVAPECIGQYTPPPGAHPSAP